MKRRKLLQYLSSHECIVAGEGKAHTRLQNTRNGNKSFVPRHREIKASLVKEICKQLDIPAPTEK
jgi:HicA-like toxin of HicAB toxin-antitoxin system